MALDCRKNGLPPGVRFHPKDSEMLVYLHWKNQGHECANLFNDVPLYAYEPEELRRKFGPEEEDEWYVFATKGTLGKSRMVRKVGNVGKWEAKNCGKEITDGAGNVTGYKKNLSFRYKGDGQSVATDWKMVEYSLPHASGKRKTKEDLVFCKLYKGRASRKNKLMSSMADNGVEAGTSSRDFLQNSTDHLHVTNSSEQKFSAQDSEQCIEDNSQIPELPNDDLAIEECINSLHNEMWMMQMA